MTPPPTPPPPLAVICWMWLSSGRNNKIPRQDLFTYLPALTLPDSPLAVCLLRSLWLDRIWGNDLFPVSVDLWEVEQAAAEVNKSSPASLCQICGVTIKTVCLHLWLPSHPLRPTVWVLCGLSPISFYQQLYCWDVKRWGLYLEFTTVSLSVQGY